MGSRRDTTDGECITEAGRTNLRFFDSIVAAKQWPGLVDIIHTSGALDCTPDLRAAIDEITDVGANCILVRRTFLSEGEETVSVSETPLANHGPVREDPWNGNHDLVVCTPVTSLNSSEFQKRFEASGYRLVVRFNGNSSFKVGANRIRHGATLLLTRASSLAEQGDFLTVARTWTRSG